MSKVTGKQSWYAIVSFGGTFPGKSVFRTRKEAESRIALLRTEGQQPGRWRTDDAVLASLRINEYSTREKAKHANIAD